MAKYLFSMALTTIPQLLNQSSNGTKIILTLPLPCSVNESLAPIGGRLVKTTKARTFLRDALTISKLNPELRGHQELLTRWIHERNVLRVDCVFAWPYSRLFTNESNKSAKHFVRQIDAHNRIKQMHDALSEIFQIDDQYFFAGDTEKVFYNALDIDIEPFSIVKITKHKPRTLQEVVISI